MAVLRACLTMLPRLDARESLTAAQRVGVGTGSHPKDVLGRLNDTWTAEAFPRRRRRMRRVQVTE